MAKTKEKKPTTAQLEQQCKEYSEALGFENPMKKKSNTPRCATCGSKDINMIGVCLNCGNETE